MADSAADVEAHVGGAKQTAKDLFAGAAGGVAQVLLGECPQRRKSGSRSRQGGEPDQCLCRTVRMRLVVRIDVPI